MASCAGVDCLSDICADAENVSTKPKIATAELKNFIITSYLK
ncbi:hypothetical protein PH505_em00010 [Pseudoalteromonas distincta]|nr:hypothetical protein PH505_em00010 [Pseudoalteromonas distincta]